MKSRSIPESEGTLYLTQYLSGEAEECVESLLTLATPDSFQEALQLLNDKFGSEFVVSEAFLQKLRDWPKI